MRTGKVQLLMRRLNPCCSGQWSSTKMEFFLGHLRVCLNPCCSGQWSSTSSAIKGVADGIVLILVVVDNGLVQSINERRTLLIKS